MSDLLATFLIIMSEAAAFFAFVIIVALVFRIRSGMNLKRSAKEFVKQIKSESPEHSDKLKNILLDNYNMDEKTAAQAVENFVKLENILYSKIIELYLGDKKTNLDDIDADVKNLTNVMHSVTVVNSKIEPEVSPEENQELTNKLAEFESQVEQLKDEKKEVQEQLQSAMDTMEGMMTEYASMYAGGTSLDKMNPDDDIAKVKDKIAEIKTTNKLKTNPVDDEEIENASESEIDAEIDLNLDVPELDVDDSENK